MLYGCCSSISVWIGRNASSNNIILNRVALSSAFVL
jgi:hypothetical protein